MKLDVLKIDGSKAGDITAAKTVFGIEPNAAVVRQAVLAEMTNMRQGTHASKTVPWYGVVVGSPGNKKAVVLPVLEPFVLPCGKVVELFSAQSHMGIITNCLKKSVAWLVVQFCPIKQLKESWL